MSSESKLPGKLSTHLRALYGVPRRLVLVFVCLVFLVEAAIMFLLTLLPGMSPWLMTLVDAGLLALLLWPVFHLVIFHPYLAQVRQRERAEAQLREAQLRVRREEQYRFVLENTSDVIYMVRFSEEEPLGVPELVSEQVDEVLGVEAARLIAEPDLWYASVHPDDLLRVRRATRLMLRSGEPVTRSYRLKNNVTGVYRWMEDRITPRKDDEGEVVGMLGVARDVTEQKVAEEEISRTTLNRAVLNRLLEISLQELPLGKQLERALDVILDAPWLPAIPRGGIWLTTEESQLLELRAHRRFPAETLQNCGSLEFGQCVCGKTAAGGMAVFAGPGDGSHELCRVDQTPHCHYCVPIRLGEKLLGIFNIYLDPDHRCDPREEQFLEMVARTLAGIIVRKRAEEERERLASLVDQASEAIFITDTEASIQYVNRAFERLTGFSSTEAVGANPRILSSGHHEAEFYQRMWRELVAGRAWSEQLTNRHKNGALYHMEATIWALRDDAGRVTGYAAVQRDVTKELQMEQALGQSQKLEALGTLAGGVAHDFNNILVPILGYSELALSRVEAEHVARPHLEKIHRAAERARDLVRQILAFSRRSEQQVSPMPLGPVVKEALNLLRATIPTTVEIARRIDAPDTYVMADATRIHQVLMNLCANAVYAMKEQGGTLSVELCEARVEGPLPGFTPEPAPGDYVRLTVQDTGKGMPPEVAARIFEPFFTTKPKDVGTGLGMAAVHGIVLDHGGSIGVQTTEGQGTVVRVYLPRACASRSEELPTRNELPRGSGQILFVDDEESVGAYAKEFLEELGYEVSNFEAPEAALGAFRSDPDRFDLLITDQTMPGMTGIALIGELMRLRPGLPVILCTGYAASLTEDEVRAAGVKTFLTKPMSGKVLGSAVADALKPLGPSGRTRGDRAAGLATGCT